MDKLRKTIHRREIFEKIYSFANSLFSDVSKIKGQDEEDETVKVLTADGKLVAISAKELKDQSAQTNVSNKELLKWSKTVKGIPTND